jgi:hypothetical protein
MIKILATIFVATIFVALTSMAGELPKDMVRTCYYGAHTNVNGTWHEVEGSLYHCHYWRKSSCKEVHNGKEIWVPCWTEEFPAEPEKKTSTSHILWPFF